MPTVAMNDFARRQTKDSPFSYFAGSEEELVNLVIGSLVNERTRPAFRDGVLYVQVSPKGFFSGVVRLEKNPPTLLRSVFSSRRDGEEPMISTFAKGEKAHASFVEILVYRHDVLAADGENSSEADWEIVSINASAVENEPQNPVSMARNMLGLEGGTKTEYPAEEFARAILYWSQHAMVDPE